MSLIKCPECEKEISDTINTCIHCGYSLKQENKISCPECGVEVHGSNRACNNCGFEFNKNSVVVKDNTAKKNNGIKSLKPIRKRKIIIISICTIIFIVIATSITFIISNSLNSDEKIVVTCVEALKEALKYPDSLIIKDAKVYEPLKIDDEKDAKETADVDANFPVCIIKYSLQDCFGEKTVSYAYFTYNDFDDKHELYGTCNTLDEDDALHHSIIDYVACCAINDYFKKGTSRSEINIEKVEKYIEKK